MAISPYKNPDSILNRSRSSSCSSPIRNRIIYQEIYSMGVNTLVRSYSCDQVFDKDASGMMFQTTKIQVSSFITPKKKIRVKPVESKPKELDLPSEVCENTEQTPSPETRVGVFKSSLKMMFTLLTVASASVLYFYVTYRECSYVWDLERTESELKDKIFGQNQAIAKINLPLKNFNSTNDIHVMVFVGGVGVGKTLASSIIRRNFPWSSNKLITYSEYFTAGVDKLLNQKLSTCGGNLVVIDDLSVKSSREAINLIALLNNKRKQNENLLVILIFQVHTEAERNEIFNEFRNTYVTAYHIPFKPLTEDVVEKCFKAEIQRQGVEIPETELRKLVEDKMKYIDILKGPSGCKGVTEEVASLFVRKT